MPAVRLCTGRADISGTMNIAATNEAERLAALRRYDILDTGPEEAFDDLAGLAANVCGTSMGAVDFVDADRVWVKANVGFSVEELPRDAVFAADVILRPELMIVRDTLQDERFADSPLVTEGPGVRFYAGVPILTVDGHALGTLSVMDQRPRSLSADQAAGLWALCRQTMSQLELRRSLAELLRTVAGRERAEEVSEGRRELLQEIIESIADGILVVSNEGETLHANTRFAEMWRIPTELIETRSDDKLLAFVLDQLVEPEAFLARVRELYQTAREDFDTLMFKDGRVFERYSRPLIHEAGVGGRVWSFRDITGHRRAEDALRTAEAKFRSLVEQIPAITYVWDADLEPGTSHHLYTSPQSESLLGFAPEDWSADPDLWLNQLHPDDRDRAVAATHESESTDEPFSMEYRLFAKDGRVVWIRDEATVMTRDEEGRSKLILGVLFDITERKRVEEELERAWQREREAAEHLRALDEVKNLQLQAVSHDLRGPIAAVLGSALTLENSGGELEPDTRKELVQGIAASGRKLDRLVTDLLDLDRLERGVLEPNRRPTDVGELARRVVGEAALDDHPVAVEGDRIEASVDPVQVERIVENLVLNAAKHTPPGTKIWVRLRRGEHGIVVTVEDAGPGVPEDLRTVIFEPFRQGARAPGLGIGLSLVARYAELHGGWARVGDRQGGGASFEVLLQDGPPGEQGAQELEVDASRATASRT